MSKRIARAPKRRIERRRTTIRGAILNTASNDDLHVAEDSKTLVRIHADLSTFRVSAATAQSNRFAFAIHIAPQAASVISLTVNEEKDQDIALQEIARFMSGDTLKTLVGQYRPIRWQIDTKAMRKMAKGDVLRLTHIADDSSEYEFVGQISTWFKE